MCGSTVTDHTQFQCSLNQNLLQIRGVADWTEDKIRSDKRAKVLVEISKLITSKAYKSHENCDGVLAKIEDKLIEMGEV